MKTTNNQTIQYLLIKDPNSKPRNQKEKSFVVSNMIHKRGRRKKPGYEGRRCRGRWVKRFWSYSEKSCSFKLTGKKTFYSPCSVTFWSCLDWAFSFWGQDLILITAQKALLKVLRGMYLNGIDNRTLKYENPKEVDTNQSEFELFSSNLV